ncbi:GIY-YIG catalytic domain-containing protein [Albimonas donghaensis]|uniref:GIY-YIG catalytic domain-containing protein n=1 Tax=Albimonas donghaensis TaxID=356660 RepID=A0A1H3ASN5_9RHOB|nr:GIY-YIG nuclease family protein [Albimonas donghaensis]SDX32707.1 GIY-YIG catalytic domain-containing protein [Albimonas donghaensis]
MFDFTEIVERLGRVPAATRLLRHDRVGLAHWRKGRDRFGAFVSYQLAANSPYAKAEAACHFVPGPPAPGGGLTALFVGATRILGKRPWDGVARPALDHPDVIETSDKPVEVFDLAWIESFEPWEGRILIDWGGSARAWSQWAHRQRKPVLELRASAADRPFPGFVDFLENVRDVPELPQAWQGALASVGGVYLLACLESGRLYVGSATGVEGFLSRWTAYAADGHGGNLLLKEASKRDYMVSVLEVASPAASQADLLAREALWKRRLGTRAHGLNAN